MQQPDVGEAMLLNVAFVKGEVIASAGRLFIGLITRHQNLLIDPTLQRHELWALHGEWVRDTQPDFGPGTAERFRAASQITQEQVGCCSAESVPPIILANPDSRANNCHFWVASCSAAV